MDDLGYRLFAKDLTLWPPAPGIADRLGWLSIVGPMRREAPALRDFAGQVAADGYRRALLLGMGGSSLCSEVLARTFGARPGCLELRVLDSTVPAAVREADAWSREARTLLIVASKSGRTIETASFARHFGDRPPGDFIAITDPGSPLEKSAREAGWRRVFLNPPDIDGRYSALSFFGLVPAALLGVDLEAFLVEADATVHADNAGVRLGTLMNEALAGGRDKLTLVLGPRVAPLGSWIEQLVAESLGKEGQGILPVDGEPAGDSKVYGSDRLFACIESEREAKRLAREGMSVMRFGLCDPIGVGREFLRWEVATAAAGALMGINPFDEPIVKESKDITAELLKAGFPAEEPAVEESGLALYADPALEADGGVADWLAAHFARAAAGDYAAFLPFLHRTPAAEAELLRMRVLARDRLKLATSVGFGPRYLHSTGQYFKGGPNTGLFLLITADDGAELPISGQPYGFSRLKQAQAVGDFLALVRHGRRAVRCHLSGDAGLPRLRELLEAAL